MPSCSATRKMSEDRTGGRNGMTPVLFLMAHSFQLSHPGRMGIHCIVFINVNIECKSILYLHVYIVFL